MTSVYEVQLQISGSDQNNIRLNTKDMIMTPRKVGGAEGIMMAYTVNGSVRLTWDPGIGDTNLTIRPRQCHHLPDTQLTTATPLTKGFMLGSGEMQHFFTDTPSHCCLVCYENAACESWQYFVEGPDSGMCWLVRGVLGLRYQRGMHYGRIRGQIL